MYKFYQKREVLFAVSWIVLYCVVSIPIRGLLGDGSPLMMIALLAIALGLTVFIKKHHLEEKYGLHRWPRPTARNLWFLPLAVLATGNLWGGVQLTCTGQSLFFSVLSMLLIGYTEEVIFRGLLFKGMIKEDGLTRAILVSAVTFGIGHIVNLLAGQASLATVMQVFFAIAWGFLFTLVFYKSKSLLPCALTHGIVNCLSLFSRGSAAADWVYIAAVILAALLYCPYLLRQAEEGEPS
ncbi:MAG: CPBP family intramembrane metalloprotease [Clostridia bacterium]|nr:CPBP family intramembrane metalloprotease [Clostridia bacterium]